VRFHLQGGAIGDGALDECIDLGFAADVMGDGEAAETGAAIRHAAIRGQLVEGVEGKGDAAALEHGDGVEGPGLARPAHRLPKGDGAGQVVGAERDDADALVHNLPLTMKGETAMAETEMERIVLVRHIEGAPSPDDFRIERLPIPELADGQFLARNHFVSCDPGTRSRLSPGASYAPPLQPGAPVDGFSVGEVIASRNERFAVGDKVALTGWATHVVSNGRGYAVKLPDLGVPETLWIGLLGVPGMTAWFGLKRVAALKAGERVLVTSAAGPVGATAGQLARLWGASEVIGIAGGAEKCAWLKEIGFTHALDYKAADFEQRFAEAAAAGFDVMFDNVGNAMIDRALPHMKLRGRIVVSGQVADYNTPAEQTPGLKHTREFIGRRLRMEGLVVFDDLPQFAAAQAELAGLIQSGAVQYREEIFDGLASLPEAFCGLFTGASFGRRLVRV